MSLFICLFVFFLRRNTHLIKHSMAAATSYKNLIELIKKSFFCRTVFSPADSYFSSSEQIKIDINNFLTISTAIVQNTYPHERQMTYGCLQFSSQKQNITKLKQTHQRSAFDLFRKFRKWDIIQFPANLTARWIDVPNWINLKQPN